MNVAIADLWSHQTSQNRFYDVHATLVRYVRAADSGAAINIGSSGLKLTHGAVPASEAHVETVVAHQPVAFPYHHKGQVGLWRVEIDVDATVRAASAEQAAEAAHQLVTVSVSAAATDAFEFELEI